jgi:ammonia channel protein AmtB
METSNLYLVLVIIILVQFSWYYFTLPGSRLSPNKKHPQASIKTALVSYLTYVIPMIIAIYYLNSKDVNCSIAKAYIGLICKK